MRCRCCRMHRGWADWQNRRRGKCRATPGGKRSTPLRAAPSANRQEPTCGDSKTSEKRGAACAAPPVYAQAKSYGRQEVGRYFEFTDVVVLAHVQAILPVCVAAENAR